MRAQSAASRIVDPVGHQEYAPQRAMSKRRSGGAAIYSLLRMHSPLRNAILFGDVLGGLRALVRKHCPNCESVNADLGSHPLRC
jgi:hypothetical protein